MDNEALDKKGLGKKELDKAHLDKLPHAPLRTCIVTRTKAAPQTMLRFVVAPDGRVVPDLARRLPGRGAWVRLARDLVEKAISRKAFTRAFKKAVSVPADLASMIDDLLVQAALEALSLANKSGALVSSSAKIAEGATKQPVACLIHAGDASLDGIRKLEMAMRASFATKSLDFPAVYTGLLTGEALDRALGRENVRHIAVFSKGGIGDYVVASLERLAYYRGLKAK